MWCLRPIYRDPHLSKHSDFRFNTSTFYFLENIVLLCESVSGTLSFPPLNCEWSNSRSFHKTQVSEACVFVKALTSTVVSEAIIWWHQGWSENKEPDSWCCFGLVCGINWDIQLLRVEGLFVCILEEPYTPLHGAHTHMLNKLTKTISLLVSPRQQSTCCILPFLEKIRPRNFVGLNRTNLSIWT